MKNYNVELEFIEPLLGTIPKDKEVYKNYILKRAALDDDDIAAELNSVDVMEDKSWTGFHQVDGNPILYDYVIKGFFKDVCGMLRRVPKTESSKLTAHKKVIDGLLFVKPRQIPLIIPDGKGMDILERSLRVKTAQGERVCLARSDTCPPGTTLSFHLTIIGGISEKLLNEWLDYGKRRGLGQWRNGGYGSFEYRMWKA